jgi:bifunctional non-homologous end joining protein LigD
VWSDGDTVSLLTRAGKNCADRLPRLRTLFRDIPTKSCVIDGELVAAKPGRPADIWTLQRAMGASYRDQPVVAAFDLLFLNGIDTRELPLKARKALLKELLEKAAMPELVYVDDFDDGAVLLRHCDKLGIEGVVSKREDRPYRSGRRPEWLKVKCAAWREANRDRWRIFNRER